MAPNRIWWIASYPKSGSTWVRVLLANYLRNGKQPVDIDELDATIASARDFFDEHVGIEASDLTHAEIDRYRPAAYEEAARRAGGPMYVKVHDAFARNADGLPLFPRWATAGILYLVRNPLDVAVSFAHHAGVPVETAVEWMRDPECSFAADPTALHPQLRQRLSTWSAHVRSWIDGRDLPLLVVRYEDLSRDPLAAFTSIARFLRLEVEAARVAQAVAFSAFAVLQAQERAHGFRERFPGAAAFFRRGEVGAWRDSLPPALVARVIADHGPIMRRFGYLSPHGQPID